MPGNRYPAWFMRTFCSVSITGTYHFIVRHFFIPCSHKGYHSNYLSKSSITLMPCPRFGALDLAHHTPAIRRHAMRHHLTTTNRWYPTPCRPTGKIVQFLRVLLACAPIKYSTVRLKRIAVGIICIIFQAHYARSL